MQGSVDELPTTFEAELSAARERVWKTPWLLRLLPLFLAGAGLGLVIPGQTTEGRLWIGACIALAGPTLWYGLRRRHDRMKSELKEAGSEVKFWFRSSEVGLVFF